MTPIAKAHQEKARRQKAAELSHVKWTTLPPELIYQIYQMVKQHEHETTTGKPNRTTNPTDTQQLSKQSRIKC